MKILKLLAGCTVAQWLVILPHSEKALDHMCNLKARRPNVDLHVIFVAPESITVFHFLK